MTVTFVRVDLLFKLIHWDLSLSLSLSLFLSPSKIYNWLLTAVENIATEKQPLLTRLVSLPPLSVRNRSAQNQQFLTLNGLEKFWKCVAQLKPSSHENISFTLPFLPISNAVSMSTLLMMKFTCISKTQSV